MQNIVFLFLVKYSGKPGWIEGEIKGKRGLIPVEMVWFDNRVKDT